jgi:DNA-binding beta-propeller fold protein YncE
VSVLNTSGNQVIATIRDVGPQPGAIAITPDGRHAYVAVSDRTLRTIDTATGAVAPGPRIGGFALGLALVQPVP